MSNKINIRFRRKVLLQHFRGRGRAESGNDCWRPALGSSQADLAEFQRERLKLRRGRQLKRAASSDHRRGGSIAHGNRNGIKRPGDAATPHEHKREISRRQHQQAS